MAQEVNMARIYAAHMNMMLVVKGLHRKKHITDNILNELVDSCLKDRTDQQEQLKQPDVDFDGIDIVLYTAMKLNVLTELELISDESIMRRICIECNGILMRKSLDFTNNRNFLGKLTDRYRLNAYENTVKSISCRCFCSLFNPGYTILTLVRTHIFAYKKAGNRARRPDTSVSSPSKITDRLFDILQRTPDCIDFLVEAVSEK